MVSKQVLHLVELCLYHVLNDIDALSSLASNQVLDIDVVGQSDSMVEHVLQIVLSRVQVGDLATKVLQSSIEKVLEFADVGDAISQSRVVVVLWKIKSSRLKRMVVVHGKSTPRCHTRSMNNKTA